MVESQTMRKLNLSAPVDKTVDLFIALIKLITISLTHQITNKVMVRYRKKSTVHLQLDEPTFKFFRCGSLEELNPGFHTLFGNVEALL